MEELEALLVRYKPTRKEIFLSYLTLPWERAKDAYWNIHDGLHNLKIWLPIIWKLRTFDHCYLFGLIHKQLEQMELRHREVEMREGSKQIADAIMRAKKLSLILRDESMDEGEEYNTLRAFYESLSTKPYTVFSWWD